MWACLSTIIPNDPFASTGPGVSVKQLMTGVGYAASIVLIVWLMYQLGLKIIAYNVDIDRKECDAKHAGVEAALKDQISQAEAATEAATFLINRSALSGKVTTDTVTVCTPIPAVQGEPKREPRMADYRDMCGDSEHNVVFPVAYDAYGKATIGTPTVKR